MKTKRCITYFLSFISMVMLAVPVILHYRHKDGTICMKNDPPSDGRCHHQDACNEHRCRDTGCMTTHFFQQIPSPNNSDIQPHSVWVTTLFAKSLLRLLTLPDETGIRQEFIYLESLHGTFITRTTGFCAPPSVLAQPTLLKGTPFPVGEYIRLGCTPHSLTLYSNNKQK